MKPWAPLVLAAVFLGAAVGGDGLEERSVLIVNVQAVDGQGLQVATPQFADEVEKELNEFFQEMSGGLTRFRVDVHDHVLISETFDMSSRVGGSRRRCDGSGDGPPFEGSIAIDARKQLGEEAWARPDHVVYSLARCQSLGFAGSGQMPGNQIWMNGMLDAPRWYAVILAHELGHNFGIDHAEHADREYGNTFSVMGRSNALPEGHFSVGAKAHVGWLREDAGQIMVLEADELDSTGVTVWLHAHDLGSYRSGSCFGVRLSTAQTNEVLWIEHRSDRFFEKLVPGALVNWVFRGRKAVFGPSQLLDFVRLSNSQHDAPLPVGEAFVYDLGSSNLLISVLEEDDNAIKLHLAQLDPDAVTAAENATNLSIPQVTCDTETSIDVPEAAQQQLVHFLLDDPAEVEFEQTCDMDLSEEMGDLAGVYLFPRFPLGQMTQQGRIQDPRIGAALFEPFGTACDLENCVVHTDLGPRFSTFQWNRVEGTTTAGMPVYRWRTFFFVFVPGAQLPTSGEMVDAWVISNQVLATTDTTAWLAFVVPTNSTTDAGRGRLRWPPLLPSLARNIQVAAYRDQETGEWLSVSEPWIRCARQTKRVIMNDRVTNGQGLATYEEFTDSNYLLVAGGSGRVTIRPRCRTLYCSANSYYDTVLEACVKCPMGMVSNARSVGREACFRDCSLIVLQSSGNDDSGPLEPITAAGRDLGGIYRYDGVRSWTQFDPESRGGRALSIYHVRGRWVVGPGASSTFWFFELSREDAAHPAALRQLQQGIKVSCACENAAERRLPDCGACPTNSVPEPSRPWRCFTPCRTLMVDGGRELDQISGHYNLTRINENGRAVFTSSDFEIWQSDKGTWRIGAGHKTGVQALLERDLDSSFWPTGLDGAWRAADGVLLDVRVTCSPTAELVDNLYARFGLAEAPTLPPSKAGQDEGDGKGNEGGDGVPSSAPTVVPTSFGGPEASQNASKARDSKPVSKAPLSSSGVVVMVALCIAGAVLAIGLATFSSRRQQQDKSQERDQATKLERPRREQPEPTRHCAVRV
ncbi:Peptidase_M11 domain-containing protein (Fragment) [Durusdinium trenchii]|uniref:Peptidase_M11 domain-containing protein n=1 Tax=Durusdinium trenchii TaxID=1381693 RepID=A0ABP0IMY4_9DINO